MVLALITYNTPHIKTEQILLKLLAKGYDPKDMILYGLPFTPRTPREVAFAHRPDHTQSVPPKELAETHGIEFIPVNADTDIPGGHDLYMILGAGILSPECVERKKILNAHPGIIPACRGLDAFKWAIADKKLLGVTLHTIDAQVDAGEVIAIVPTPVYPSDTLETLARRHYEIEMDLMADFQRYIDTPANPFADIAEGKARMRMKRETEEAMVASFSAYKETFALQSSFA